MKRVNAVGFYGWGNFGDELFRAAIEHNKNLLWGDQVSVRSFVMPVRFIHQNLGPIGAISRFLSAIIGALWADKIAMCGGSLFQDVSGNQSMRRFLSKNRRQVEALGVSIGPYVSEEARLRVESYISQMERVIVRDTASAERIEEPVIIGGDLAALYPMPVVPYNKRNHLTICISNDSGADVEELTRLLSALLPEIDLPVRFLALNVRPKHGDVEISEELARRLRPYHSNIEVFKFETIHQTIKILAESRAVWSQRLHGLVVSYLCDVPFLAFSHHQKITDFATDIQLEASYLRSDLSLSGGLVEVAKKMITNGGRTNWGISSSQYKRCVRDAFTYRDTLPRESKQ